MTDLSVMTVVDRSVMTVVDRSVMVLPHVGKPLGV